MKESIRRLADALALNESGALYCAECGEWTAPDEVSYDERCWALCKRRHQPDPSGDDTADIIIDLARVLVREAQ